MLHEDCPDKKQNKCNQNDEFVNDYVEFYSFLSFVNMQDQRWRFLCGCSSELTLLRHFYFWSTILNLFIRHKCYTNDAQIWHTWVLVGETCFSVRTCETSKTSWDIKGLFSLDSSWIGFDLNVACCCDSTPKGFSLNSGSCSSFSPTYVFEFVWKQKQHFWGNQIFSGFVDQGNLNGHDKYHDHCTQSSYHEDRRSFCWWLPVV